MELTKNELEWLANHLGHSMHIHFDFYRLPDNVISLAKVARLLLSFDAGQVHEYAGKSLKDINLDGKIINRLVMKGLP